MALPAEKTVLVVDDEDGVRLYLKTALKDAGFKVETAADGLEALEKVGANPPDAISLDLVMPKKSGAKFLYELRKNKEWQRIPVILVTAHAKDDLGKKDFEGIMEGRMLLGPGSYLEKPVKAETYVNSIKRALNIEVSEETPIPDNTKEEIEELLDGADPEELQRVLKMLKQKQQK
ncbi:MAG: response regulator [bacterium]